MYPDISLTGSVLTMGIDRVVLAMVSIRDACLQYSCTTMSVLNWIYSQRQVHMRWMLDLSNGDFGCKVELQICKNLDVACWIVSEMVEPDCI